MALVFKDRVKETSTTTGTGTYTLAGAAAGFQAFSTVGNGNTCYYVAIMGNAWEIGLGTYTLSGTTLARTAILASTNSNNAVNWGAGTKTIFLTLPAGFLSDPLFNTVELGAVDTTISRAAAGRIAVEGSNVLMASDLGLQTMYIPASSMVPRITNGPSIGLIEMGTNRNMFDTLDFDTNTQEFAQFSFMFPESWDEGTVQFAPVWSHPSTSTNFGVVFGLAGVAYADDDAGDAAFGTAQTSSDTGGTTNDIYIGPTSAAITIAGSPGAGEYCMFQINRTVANAGDTMAVDARLHGIKLLFTTNALKDAS